MKDLCCTGMMQQKGIPIEEVLIWSIGPCATVQNQKATHSSLLLNMIFEEHAVPLCFEQTELRTTQRGSA